MVLHLINLRRMMSRQLAVSAAFSIFAMAVYVLFSGNAVRAPLDGSSTSTASSVEISAAPILFADGLLPLLVR
jgi:hypothetical protein